MTGTTIATLVRDNTGDTSGVDPNDTNILSYINIVTRAIWDNRATSQFNENGSRREMTEITAIGNTIDLSDDYESDLVNGVVGILRRRKGKNEEDMAMSQTLLASFKASIGVAL